ncbi:MAG: nucleotide pyrophosphatase/phosphodiesterase family protein [Bdellovibrionia bacterium]
MATSNSKFMNPTAVVNVVGLTSDLLSRIPSLAKFAKENSVSQIKPAFPALTCSAQSTYLTGLLPKDHGIVGNGWYFQDLSQIWFWRQSNKLVQGDKLWDFAKRRNPEFSCANMFWWYNMYSSVDYSVTVRPVYRSDGLKLPDSSSEPPELRQSLQGDLGQFPLFQFWGPGASIRSSDWIAKASQLVFQKHKPTLTLIYLPHLDYVLQKEGPKGLGVTKALSEIDLVCKELIAFFKSQKVQLTFISEYGINEVKSAISLNRILRQKGWLRIKEECGEEHLDPGASRAFAVADHQIAHVYVQDLKDLSSVRKVLEAISGIEKILDRKEQIAFGMNHSRSGDFVLIAQSDHWFSYPYWFDDRKAPDFARTVEIHKKPGFDPVELFIDPKIRFPKLKIAKTLLRKKLGFRYLMDVIPLDDSLVKGSHGSSLVPEEFWPVFMTERTDLLSNRGEGLQATEIRDLLLDHIF